MLREHTNIPVLPEVRAASAFVQDVCIRDSAPANIASDEIGYALGGDALRLCTGCTAHGISNSLAYAFTSVKEFISGMVSCSLAQKPGGAVPLLRLSLAEILFRHVQVRRGMLEKHDARLAYRDAVLDLCLKRDAAGIARRGNLELLLNGDLQSSTIHLHVQGDIEVNVRQWADAVAALLLPATIPVFPRFTYCVTLTHLLFNEKWNDQMQCMA